MASYIIVDILNFITMQDKFNFAFKRANALFELMLRICLWCTGQLIQQRLEYFTLGSYATLLKVRLTKFLIYIWILLFL